MPEDCGRLERITPNEFVLTLRSDCATTAEQIMNIAFDDVIWDSIASVTWYPALDGPDFRRYIYSKFHRRAHSVGARLLKPQRWRCDDCDAERVARGAPGGQLKCAPCQRKTAHHPA